MGLFSSGIGIDISDHHVRIALVSAFGRPKGLYELVLPHGLIVDDEVVKPEHLSKELSAVIANAGLTGLVAPTTLLIPESRVFSTSFNVEKGLPALEAEAVALKTAQRTIPIPFSQAKVALTQDTKTKGENLMAVHAVQNEVIKPLLAIFNRKQFPFKAIEANNLALFRLVQRFGDRGTLPHDESTYLMIVDVGHRWTNVSLYNKAGLVVFSRSIALRKLHDGSDGKAKVLPSAAVEKICQIMQETVAFFLEQGKVVKIGLLAGVEGEQKEVAQNCAKAMKGCTIVRIGEAVAVPDTSGSDVHAFGAAIGAGLRAVSPRKYRLQHNFYNNES